MISAYTKNAIVLGLLAAVGPFAIDMYIPALPMATAIAICSVGALILSLLTLRRRGAARPMAE